MVRRKLSTRKFWILIVVLFCFSSLFYGIVWSGAPVVVPDSANYQSLAADLQDGRLDNLHGRTPGYALLLIAFGSVSGAGRSLFFAQLILYFFSISLIVWLLLRFSLSREWIFLFIILALLPYNTVHTAYMLTETLAQFFLVSGVVLLLAWLDKGKWYLIVLSSIGLSLCAITRPTYQFLPIVIVIVLLILTLIFSRINKRLLGATIALVMGAVIIIGSLVVHNSRNFQSMGLTPDLGFFLSTKTARVLERLPDEYAPVREILIHHRDQLLLAADSYHTGYMFIWSAIPDLQQQTNLSYRELSRYMLNLNLLLITKAPLIYLQEVTYSLSNFWLPATTELSDFSSRLLQLVWTSLHYITALAYSLVSVFFGGLCLLFMALPGGKKKRLFERMSALERNKIIFVVIIFVSIFYTILVTILTDMGVARHRIPVELFIFSSILLGVDYWFKIKRKFTSGSVEILKSLFGD